jgi:hypothetical protein
MYNYIIFFIICFLIILCLAHIIQLKKQNNELRILQTYDPEINTITELFKEKLPIILVDEINLWSLENKENQDRTIINIELQELSHILKDNFVHRRIIQNLDHYALSLSRGWSLSLETVKNTPSSKIIPLKEKNYLRLIGCLKGEMRVMLFPPNLNKSILDDPSLSTKLMEPKSDIPCLEIIIRIGSMIYIPYGWWVFIYSHEKTILLDAVNSSVFGMI